MLTETGNPPLPIGFHQSAVNTLCSPFTYPEALKAQLYDLSNWARKCIPNNVIVAATETLDMDTWCADAPPPPIYTATSTLPCLTFCLALQSISPSTHKLFSNTVPSIITKNTIP